MLANKKIIMSTCTLVVILFGSFLFIQNDNIHNISQQITETEITPPQVVEEKQKQKEVKEQSKTILHTQKEMKNEEVGDIKTQKITKYTNNLSQERIANAEYFIRDDGWIPHYLEPIDINNIYIPAFYGDIAHEFLIEFDHKVNNIEQKKIDLENFTGYSILTYSLSGTSGMTIEFNINNITAKEVNQIKSTLSTMDSITWFATNSGVLPEYNNDQFKAIIDNSIIPEG